MLGVCVAISRFIISYKQCQLNISFSIYLLLVHGSKLLCRVYIDICAKVMHSIPIDSHFIGFSKNHISFLTLKAECLSFPFHAFMSLMTSYTTLNRRGERKHPCFIPDDGRSIFSNLPLTVIYNKLPTWHNVKESTCRHRSLRKCSFDS